ncbi:GNAT family N-acetyltransferase [Paraburkholderia sp. BCC1884]|uniref:GNAT family N-acetyltransferase n=1 Tax=Paraburkholderia sp. BCC1884 TaxID=2562668 RepID=UPI001183A3F1|nr:N-acetyltransferase [Paraburkholderia sp. BCC1884]
MNQLCSIRRARATDLPSIYVGELDYIRQIEPEQEARWKDGMRFHLKQWTNDLDRMFIAECADGAEGADPQVGYCFWEVHGEAAVLASIYVTPQRRGSGLGQQLLARFIADAQAQGFSKLTLGVKADNPARRLYEKAGFVYTHDEHGYRHYLYSMSPVDEMRQ